MSDSMSTRSPPPSSTASSDVATRKMSRGLSGAVPDLKKVLHQIVGLPKKFFGEFFAFASQFQLRHEPKFDLIGDESMVSIKLYLPGHLVLEFRLGLSYPNTAPSFLVVAPQKNITKEFPLDWNLSIEQKIDRLNAATENIISYDENNPSNPFYFAYGEEGHPTTTNETLAKENGYHPMITNYRLEDVNTEELSSGTEYPEDQSESQSYGPKKGSERPPASPPPPGDIPPPPPPGDIPPPPGSKNGYTKPSARSRGDSGDDQTSASNVDDQRSDQYHGDQTNDTEEESDSEQRHPKTGQKIKIRLAAENQSESEMTSMGDDDDDRSDIDSVSTEMSDNSYSTSQRSESVSRSYGGPGYTRNREGKKIGYYGSEGEIHNFQAISVPIPGKQPFLPRTARFRCHLSNMFVEQLSRQYKYEVVLSFFNEYTKKTTTIFKTRGKQGPTAAFKLDRSWNLVTSRPDRLFLLIQLVQAGSGREVGYVKMNFLALATGPIANKLQFLDSKDLRSVVGIVNFELEVEEYYKKTVLKIDLTVDPESDIPISSELYCSVVHMPDFDDSDSRDQTKNKKLQKLTSKPLRKLYSTSWKIMINFKHACLKQLRKGALYIKLHDDDDERADGRDSQSVGLSGASTTVRIEDVFPSGFDAAVDFRSALMGRDGKQIVGDLRGVITWQGLPLLAQMEEGQYHSNQGIVGGFVIKGALQPQLRGPLHVRSSLLAATLPEMMALQRDEYPDLKVPFVLQFLCDVIVTRRGLQTENVFRASVPVPYLREVLWELDKGNFDIDLSARKAAGLIKAWLLSLKDPVIPKEYYDECAKHADASPDKLAVLVAKFPKENQEVLFHLIRILRKVAKNYKQTKMDIKALAVVMASVLIPNQNRPGFPDTLTKEIDFVENLLAELDIDRRRRQKD